MYNTLFVFFTITPFILIIFTIFKSRLKKQKNKKVRESLTLVKGSRDGKEQN